MTKLRDLPTWLKKMRREQGQEEESKLAACGHLAERPKEFCQKSGIWCHRKPVHYYVQLSSFGKPCRKIIQYCEKHQNNPWLVQTGKAIGPMSLEEAIVMLVMEA